MSSTVLDRNREDAFAEHGDGQDLQNGHQATLAKFKWLEGDMELLNPSEQLAHKILFGLARVLRTSHGTLRHTFAPEDRGLPGILEPEAFLRGLVRIGVFSHDEVGPEQIAKVVLLVDSSFDGRVNLWTLGRAVTAAQSLQASRLRASEVAEADYQERLTNTYHDSLPVDAVKVEKNPRSLFNFEHSFDKFRNQQRVLLSLHKEKPL